MHGGRLVRFEKTALFRVRCNGGESQTTRQTAMGVRCSLDAQNGFVLRFFREPIETDLPLRVYYC